MLTFSISNRLRNTYLILLHTKNQTLIQSRLLQMISYPLLIFFTAPPKKITDPELVWFVISSVHNIL